MISDSGDLEQELQANLKLRGELVAEVAKSQEASQPGGVKSPLGLGPFLLASVNRLGNQTRGRWKVCRTKGVASLATSNAQRMDGGPLSGCAYQGRFSRSPVTPNISLLRCKPRNGFILRQRRGGSRQSR
jgi:hypothetical protein